MRDTFHRQLELLTSDIAVLCDTAGEAIRHATDALLYGDVALAEQVIGDRDQIVVEAADVVGAGYRLLVLQSPVASDLHAVVSSIQNAADAERMGALALHVAEAARRRHPGCAVPEPISSVFGEMGTIAVQISSAAADVVLSGDVARSAQLSRDDERMDALHRNLFAVVMNDQWSHGVSAAVDVTLLSRYYERFADHAVEIGRRAVGRRERRIAG